MEVRVRRSGREGQSTLSGRDVAEPLVVVGLAPKNHRDLACISPGPRLVGLTTASLAGACLLVWRSAPSPVTRIVGLLLLLGGAAGLGQISLPAQDGPSRGQLHARLVQGGIPQERKWLEEEFLPTLTRYELLSFGQPMPGAAPEPALIVWPEVAVPQTQDFVRDYLDEMDRLLRARRIALALGILTETEAGRFNSLIVLGNGRGDLSQAPPGALRRVLSRGPTRSGTGC